MRAYHYGMEINRKYLDALIKEMDSVDYKNTSHILDIIVEPIEAELLMGESYERQIPEGHPDKIERMLHARQLQYPADCIYDENKFRLGVTRLHIRPKNANKNVDSAVMIYMGEAETIDIGAKAHSAKDVATVMLHDNGVISASYTRANSQFIIVNSWYYPGMDEFGGLPYPRSEDEVYAEMVRALKKLSLAQMFSESPKLMRSKTFKTIPKTVMLAVNTYDKAK